MQKMRLIGWLEEIRRTSMSKEIKDLVDDLGWDYDRMSEGGKETYKKLCLKLGWEFETEENSHA